MTETQVKAPVDQAIDGYFAMWNEHHPERRRQLIAATWTADASYVEPLMVAEGHEALNAGIAAMQAHFPGHSLRPAGEVETHHDRARWRWELVGPDGPDAVAAGSNVAIVAPDGRLRQVTGFFDHVDGLS